MEKMTKKQFEKFAALHGVATAYSGKLRKFFLRKVQPMKIETLHMLINSRAQAFIF